MLDYSSTENSIKLFFFLQKAVSMELGKLLILHLFTKAATINVFKFSLYNIHLSDTNHAC